MGSTQPAEPWGLPLTWMAVMNDWNMKARWHQRTGPAMRSENTMAMACVAEDALACVAMNVLPTMQ